MRPVFWIVGVPLLLAGAFFAIANREEVRIDLWPLWGAVTVPLFAALVGALYAGFVIGALVAWWAGRHGRRAARGARRRAGELEAEIARLRKATTPPAALPVAAVPPASPVPVVTHP
ncbi:MAG: LapA family protein [Alphaproteobacteria bacterium]|nr:LapA family protein [Alphaproteobacteria bacterium]